MAPEGGRPATRLDRSADAVAYAETRPTTRNATSPGPCSRPSLDQRRSTLSGRPDGSVARTRVRPGRARAAPGRAELAACLTRSTSPPRCIASARRVSRRVDRADASDSRAHPAASRPSAVRPSHSAYCSIWRTPADDRSADGHTARPCPGAAFAVVERDTSFVAGRRKNAHTERYRLRDGMRCNDGLAALSATIVTCYELRLRGRGVVPLPATDPCAVPGRAV